MSYVVSWKNLQLVAATGRLARRTNVHPRYPYWHRRQFLSILVPVVQSKEAGRSLQRYCRCIFWMPYDNMPSTRTLQIGVLIRGLFLLVFAFLFLFRRRLHAETDHKPRYPPRTFGEVSFRNYSPYTFIKLFNPHANTLTKQCKIITYVKYC